MYGVIDIPCFALQAAARTEKGLEGKPVILVDGNAVKPLVLDLTRAAAEEGIRVGLGVPQAMARCSNLLVRYRSPSGEQMAGRVLFDFSYSLSPRVEETLPGVCTIDLQGVRRSDLGVRLETILSELGELDLRARIGVGPTPDLALLAAREAKGVLFLDGNRTCVSFSSHSGSGQRPGWPPSASSSEMTSRDAGRYLSNHHSDEFLAGLVVSGATDVNTPTTKGLSIPLGAFLDRLPIGACEAPEDVLSILHGWGISTVGAFAKLPRQDVGARLGFEGIALWDKVTGREERVLRIALPPEIYEECLEFEYEVESLDPLLFLTRRFLDQLCLRLKVRGLAAARVALRLPLSDIRLEDGERFGAYEVDLTVPEPTREAEILFRMLATRLEGLETDSPVVGIALKIEPTEGQDCQLGLFETSLKNPHRFTDTLARVAGIVGSERMGRPVLPDDRRPDGWSLEALPSQVPSWNEDDLRACHGLSLRRYRPALRAEVRFEARRPVWVSCGRAHGPVTDFRGPWIDSGHWWESGGWNRSEWDVELRQGGLYRLVRMDEQWFVEGEYG